MLLIGRPIAPRDRSPRLLACTFFHGLTLALACNHVRPITYLALTSQDYKLHPYSCFFKNIPIRLLLVCRLIGYCYIAKNTWMLTSHMYD
jgi:hypothetical protein